jgi:hypothetical protein
MIKNGKVFHMPEIIEQNLELNNKVDSNLKNDILI